MRRSSSSGSCIALGRSEDGYRAVGEAVEEDMLVVGVEVEGMEVLVNRGCGDEVAGRVDEEDRKS